MAKKSTKPIPTEQQILEYDNVPYTLAARFIGWSDVSVRYALQEHRAPFGIAAQNPETKTWAYNISPGALVRYKRGELEYFTLNTLIGSAASAIQSELDRRLTLARDKVERALR